MRAFRVPIEENLAQLFRDFKPFEKVKYKVKFGKCILQSYKFKINLRRTEISVIDNKLAKVVAHLCSESRIESCKMAHVDFLKSTH